MDFKALTNRALELQPAGQFEEAEACLREAARLSQHPFPRLNLGNLLFELGRLEEAEQPLREAMELAPDDWRPAVSLGLTLLALGRYAEGWSLYERRPNERRLPGPVWEGDDLAGRHIVVWPEQGFGDEIMCARYIPLLVKSAAAVTVVCSPPISPLLAGLGARIVPRGPVFALPAFDVATRILSLPRHFGEIPAPAPFDVAPRRTGARIGVKWRGNPGFGRDHWRSMPDDFGRELLSLPSAISLEPEDTGAADFRQTGEIIRGLELVICVDTSVAHLAGSLGVPTWVLLPAVATDWRWGRDRADTPWYPSVRLFRQSQPGAWDEVANDVIAAQSRA